MNKKLLLYFVLAFICFAALFLGIGGYSLLDIDETRYVSMARDMFISKDFATLYLNGEYFFEKPPLYFWIEVASFKLFGGCSEFAARFPIVVLSLLPVGLLIYLCRKVKNDLFAIVSTAVLFTCLEYVILTKIAILDSVLTSFVTSSVLCYFATFFADNRKTKNIFWILVYVFSALAVLAKGIPGIAIPMIVIFVSSVVFKSFKETLRYSWGFLIFLLIALPWHLVMLNLHGSLFWDEYVIKHHILRFLGSEVIHRNQPWYFYLLIILWGACPHILMLIAQISKIKTLKFDFKNRYDMFIVLNCIAVLSILVFFSLSGAKLITYILPVYPFLAVIMGAIWLKYITKGDVCTNRALIFVNSVLALAVVVLFFLKFVMPVDFYNEFKSVQILSIILILPFVLLNFYLISSQKRLQAFVSLAVLFALLSGVLIPAVYKFNYNFGQNDLMKFAKYAQDNNYSISTYLTGKKYSLLYYSGKSKVDFHMDEDENWLNDELNKPDNVLIIRNRDVDNLPVRIKMRGQKYSIVERIKNEG